MRFVWLAFVGLIGAMALVLPRLHRPAKMPAAAPQAAFAALRAPAAGPSARADSIVAFGLAQRGTPYVYAGTSPLTGFDCSGFIMYTFAHFGVAVPHSTALLIDVGRPVARAEAQPGDIVVFTGTAPTSTTPGHAGIIVSGRGEVPLRFVHSSSARRESGVKVSQVEGTDYERRYMQVRRVLGPGEVATMRATPAALPRRTMPVPTPVATLPNRPVAVEPANVPATALPAVLPPLQRPSHYAKKQTAAASKTTHLVHKAASRKKTVAKKATLRLKHSVAKKAVTPKPATSTKSVRAIRHR